MDKRKWSHRQKLIRERLLLSEADIVCIQEADGSTFDDDFAFMRDAGYDHCLHKKFRFRCATFFKREKFTLAQVAHKDRVLVTELKSMDNERFLNIVNCHLSGGAAPERRLRQVYEGIEQIRKWKQAVTTTLEKQRNANRPNAKNIATAEEKCRLADKAGIIVCGDFNSDGNTGVRRLLVEGSVDPEWREPQYPLISLTSKTKETAFSFLDAAELAYGANVCDGDYGEEPGFGCRPATYVVPNLASLLLLPVYGEVPRTQFGLQVARGLADSLGLEKFCNREMEQAFESLDLDGNNRIDEDEIQQLLESVYVNTCGRYQIVEDEREQFFSNFWGKTTHRIGLSREQLAGKLLALQQELEGGSSGTELVEIRTEADARIMIERFTPALKGALDHVFDEFSSDGEGLTEVEVAKFLTKTNGQLGRGGMWRHTNAVFERKSRSSQPALLSRRDWYGAFARELGEGKWWQVVYDLEACGVNLREYNAKGRHYQGWLDYVYFESDWLVCTGVQEALDDDEVSLVYGKGDALPNEWHPSDHLPVAAVFSWL